MTTGKKDVDFGINFEKERELLLRYVKKETPNIDLAEDIVQETLLKLAEYQKKEIIKSPQAFLRKIANDKIADYYRAKNRVEKVSIDEMLEKIADGTKFKIPKQITSEAKMPTGSGWSIIKEKLDPVFQKIEQGWGGLDMMKRVLDSPHREPQTLVLLLEADENSGGVLIDRICEKLKIPKRSNSKALFQNDVYSPCLNGNKKANTFYLSSVFPNQESYHIFLGEMDALEKILSFPVKSIAMRQNSKISPDIAKIVKKRLKSIRITSSVGRECLMSALFLKNPQIAWRFTTPQGLVAKTNTYSKSFFRDYFFYLMLKNGVQLSGIEKFTDVFLNDKASSDYKLLGGEILAVVGKQLNPQKVKKPMAHFKKFNTNWYSLNTVKYQNIKKQNQSFKRQIADIQKRVLQFTK